MAVLLELVNLALMHVLRFSLDWHISTTVTLDTLYRQSDFTSWDQGEMFNLQLKSFLHISEKYWRNFDQIFTKVGQYRIENGLNFGMDTYVISSPFNV